METFGGRLLQFARSTSEADRETMLEVMQVAGQYARETLGVCHAKLYLPSVNDGHRSLRRLDLEHFEQEDVYRVYEGRDKYRGHCAFAFDRNVPLWIVRSVSGKPLAGGRKLTDLWSGSIDLPKYRPLESVTGRRVQTSIVIPLLAPGRVRPMGVVNFEAIDYIEPTEDAKNELLCLAEAITTMLRLSEAAKFQNREVRLALTKIKSSIGAPLPRLTKPRIFVGYPARANDDVKDALRTALARREQLFEPVYWDAMFPPGNVMQHLVATIAECRYGLCYLSEPSGQAGGCPSYVDNTNVLFEAGMFHGRVEVGLFHHRLADPNKHYVRSWIPVREAASPELPFDLAQERMLYVPRTSTGKLKRSEFLRTLDCWFAAMCELPQEQAAAMSA